METFRPKIVNVILILGQKVYSMTLLRIDRKLVNLESKIVLNLIIYTKFVYLRWYYPAMLNSETHSFLRHIPKYNQVL